jgi:elongator complex protein 3
VVPINVKSNKIGQHQGIGTKLLKKAESIAKTNKYKRIAVISGIGVREYYYKRGYSLEGNYVCKRL